MADQEIEARLEVVSSFHSLFEILDCVADLSHTETIVDVPHIDADTAVERVASMQRQQGRLTDFAWCYCLQQRYENQEWT
ncbi:hypothetical protein ACHAWU_001162 [Discostella pseudostelligera]|uniref:Uncharacterized protein n=1 Tax=Discostella pseudostelligera TaxID=259834 RepID=A0ABD3MFW9_9STRA